jgi:D-lactate dehydrogenase (cytochrome)
MNDVQMGVLNKFGSETVRKRRWDEILTLFIKFSGTTEGTKRDIKRVSDLVQPFTKEVFHFAHTRKDEHDVWSARKEALFTVSRDVCRTIPRT